MNYFGSSYILAMPPICRMTEDAAAESLVMAMIDIGCASLRTYRRKSESFFSVSFYDDTHVNGVVAIDETNQKKSQCLDSHRYVEEKRAVKQQQKQTIHQAKSYEYSLSKLTSHETMLSRSAVLSEI